ncbi:MAG: hypothetical protein OEW96_08145, partial [Betaproteobacteria bacterium]|nr:hypothetical protein [Betaproteobacteria bacterium]
MKSRRYSPPLAAAAALVALLAAGPQPAPAQQEPRAKPPVSTPDPAQIESRLQSVGTLVETSSAARQIEASGNAEAAALRNKARQVLRYAQEAHASGDYRSAQSLLDDAARQLFEAARVAAGERATSENLG